MTNTSNKAYQRGVSIYRRRLSLVDALRDAGQDAYEIYRGYMDALDIDTVYGGIR